MSTKIPSLDLNFNYSELYVTEWCIACHDVLKDLTKAGIQVNVIHLDNDEDMQAAIKVWEKRLGFNPNRIPQLWYDGQYVGGSVSIEQFLRKQNVN